MELLALHAGSWSTTSWLPMRKLKQCMDASGMCMCMPEMGPRVLRVTLVSATDVGTRSGFYVEAWTEPAAGHPKNSRIHRDHGRTVDLGCEQLELDWFGDEREVVLHLVEYTGAKQSRDLPTCELRIPRAAVERYAREAEGHGDVRFGARSFRMAPLAKQDALQRKRRFQDMLLPSGLIARIFQKLGEEQGLHIPSAEELERLRQENRALRQENAALWTQTGVQGSATSSSEERHPAGASLALRFELLPRARGGLGGDLPFREASFQELIVH